MKEENQKDLDKINKLFLQRAELLSQSSSAENLEKESLYLRFILGTGEYGIEQQYVDEVMNLEQITSLPGAPNIVAGIINRRSDFITVINLADLFNVTPIDAKKKWCIITSVNNSFLGLIVDKIVGCEGYNPSECEQVKNNMDKEKYVTGIMHSEVTMLNINYIFDAIFKLFDK